jgi:hypothetical protein
MRAIGLAVLALALAGCELTSIELADVVDVVVAEVYLRSGPGDTIQQAFLHRTVVGAQGSRRVDGARVTVRRSDGRTVHYHEAPASSCRSIDQGDAEAAGSCYLLADPDFVVPGASYDLAIEVADGRRIEGRTTVPAAFEIVSPAASACVLRGTSLELVWTRSAEAWAYPVDARFTGLADGLAARGVVDPPDTLRLLGLAVGANDTTLAFPQELGVFDRFQLDIEVLRALQDGLPAGARADIVVAAADRNFVNWVRGGSFNPSGQVRLSSLTGEGVGVFGALVVRAREIAAPGGDGETGAWPACD